MSVKFNGIEIVHLAFDPTGRWQNAAREGRCWFFVVTRMFTASDP
jgi:hypothetical protein